MNHGHDAAPGTDVENDGDVLVLGRRFARPIVTAEQFLQTLGGVA